MPHRREAAHNVAATLGLRVADVEKFATALEGMGVVFDAPAPGESVIGSLPSATAADLRDHILILCEKHGRDMHYIERTYFEIDAELRKIGFCIARVR